MKSELMGWAQSYQNNYNCRLYAQSYSISIDSITDIKLSKVIAQSMEYISTNGIY